MTDNRTTEPTVTERLRALLTERGIKFKAWDGVHPITVWHDEQFSYEYMERSLLNGAKPHTGEVLDGTGFFKVVMYVCTPEQAIAATLGSGTLTAEQVEKATYANSIHADCVDADWQAIADELNAELGSGTCKNENTDGYGLRFECSECGYSTIVHNCAVRLDELPNYCPNCGKWVSA